MMILGVAFLYFLERDYRFAGQQARNQEAYYLALAGLQYQASRPDLFRPGGPTVKRFIPPESRTQYFEVTVDPAGRTRSRGVVETGLVITQRVLTVAADRSTREHHDESVRTQ